MKTNRKHGFTIVELVVVIAIIAVLAAVLIPTFTSIIKKANDSAYLQEKTNQRLEDLAEKVENQNYLSWEDFEVKLAEKLSKLTEENTTTVKTAVDEALKEYMKDDIGQQTGLTEDQVKKIIDKALEGQLTTAQVEVIVRQALAENNTTVDIKTINSIVSTAISRASQNGVTASQMKAAIASALAGIEHPESLTEEQITAVINAAITEKLESMDTLTEAEISALITAALEQYEVDKGTAIAITDADVARGSYAIIDGTKTYYLVTTVTKDEFSITGGTADTIIYIDAPNIKTINVDNAKEVYVIRTAMTSVHIKGTVGKLEVVSGRTVIESTATVTDVKAAPTTNTTAIVEVMANATVANPIVAEYQDHGYGTNDYIQVIDHNTVEEKKVKVVLAASDALVVSSWTTTNVILEDVSTGNVSVEDESKERLTNSAVEVTIDSGNGEPTVLQTTASGETTQKVEATVKINGTPINNADYENEDEYFAAVAAAINALENGTVVLENNATIRYSGSYITIPVGHNVTIDLNGHTITAVGTNSGTSAFITNRGTLTLVDSKAGANGIGTGKITNSATDPDDQSIPGYASNIITNNGTLTVNGGVYEDQCDSGAATYVIDNQTNGNSYTPVLTINGGRFIDPSTTLRMFCNSSTKVNTVNICGGVIEGGYTALWVQLPGSDSSVSMKAALNISGGTLTGGNGESYAFYDYSFGNSFDDTNYTISGGIFNGDIYSYGANVFNIENGTFNGDVCSQGQITTSGGVFNGTVKQNYVTIRVYYGNEYVESAVNGEDYILDTGESLSGKTVSAKYYGGTAENIDLSKISTNGTVITIDKSAIHPLTDGNFCIWIVVSDAE